jgi:hypothetical protein
MAFLRKLRRPTEERRRLRINLTISREALEDLNEVARKHYNGNRSEAAEIAFLLLAKAVRSGKIPRKGVEIEI